MNRRETLSSVGTILAGLTVGYLSAPASEPSRNGGGRESQLEYESRYVKDPIDEQIIEPGIGLESEIESFYATVITESEKTDRFDFEYIRTQEEIDDELVWFVTETDFEEACLLVVQTVLSSGSMDFELTDIERGSVDAIYAYTKTPPTTGGTGEALSASIIARVYLERPHSIDRATVTHVDNVGETTVFHSD